MKNSFILHHDTLSVIEELTDEQAGQIIKEIYRISMHLNNPEKAKKPIGLSGLLNSVLHPFKMQLYRDFETYKATALRNAENGKKGGRPPLQKNQSKPKKADSDKGNDKVSDKEKDFEIFWSAWPKKKAKGQAEAKFKSMYQKLPPLKQLLEAIDNQKTTKQWKENQGQFIPHASTWLNAKGWLDEVPNQEPTMQEYFVEPVNGF